MSAQHNVPAGFRVFGQWLFPHPEDERTVYGMGISGLIDAPDDQPITLSLVDRGDWTALGVFTTVEKARTTVKALNELFNPPAVSRRSDEDITWTPPQLGSPVAWWGVTRTMHDDAQGIVADTEEPPTVQLLVTSPADQPGTSHLYAAFGAQGYEHVCTFPNPQTADIFLSLADSLLHHVNETGFLLALPNPYTDTPQPEVLKNWYIPVSDTDDEVLTGLQVERRLDNGQYSLTGVRNQQPVLLALLNTVDEAEATIQTLELTHAKTSRRYLCSYIKRREG